MDGLYGLFLTVLNMSVTAGVVVIFVLLARLGLKRLPKVFSYVLWGVVLFRLLCPISMSSAFSLLGALKAPSEEAPAGVGSVVTYVDPDRIPWTQAPGQISQEGPPSPPEQEGGDDGLPILGPITEEPQPEAVSLSPEQIAAWVWLAGTAALGLYGLGSYLRLRRRLKEATPLEGNVWLADHIPTPFVMGVIRPNIYLPSSLPERDRGHILCHERYHIRRLDHVVKLLSFIALCLHWFNPLVWAAFILSGKDMEMSCDEGVIKALGPDIREQYAACLLRLASGRRIIAGSPLAFGEGDTRNRVKNLVRWRRPKGWVLLTAAAACAVAIAACAANPQNVPGTQGDYASMEDYARQVMADTHTMPVYQNLEEDPVIAQVTGTQLYQLERLEELAGLSPDGTLELWNLWYLVQVDVPVTENSFMGGMFEVDGWYDLEGRGPAYVVALRHPDGSYDILHSEKAGPWQTNTQSWDVVLYDWYVTDQGLDLPLCQDDWRDRITLPEGAFMGSIQVRRYDGPGWYVYIPSSGWSLQREDIGRWEWGSEYLTGSAFVVESLDSTPEEGISQAEAQGYIPVGDGGEGWALEQDGVQYRRYFRQTEDGTCWQLTIQWTPSVCSGYPNTEIEPDVLLLMAGRFTPDERVTYNGIQLPYSQDLLLSPKTEPAQTTPLFVTQLGTADLDQDGTPEQLSAEEWSANQVYLLRVSREDGADLWSEEARTDHIAWNSLYLYTHPDTGVQYLLRYLPYDSTGFATYSYDLFSLRDGKEVTVQQDSVGFAWEDLAGPDGRDILLELSRFTDGLNQLLRHSSLLLSTQDGAPVIGPMEEGAWLEDMGSLADLLSEEDTA